MNGNQLPGKVPKFFVMKGKKNQGLVFEIVIWGITTTTTLQMPWIT